MPVQSYSFQFQNSETAMNVLDQRDSRRSFLHQSVIALSGVAISSRAPLAIAQENASERFQLSLHQYSVKQLFESGELNLLNYAHFAKHTFGMLNVEFAAEFCEDLFRSPEKADAIRDQSKQAGVTNRILLCAEGHALDTAKAKERTDAIDHHLTWAKVAERLGCEYMRVRASTVGDRQQQLAHAAAGIGELCDALESSPVSVLLENLFGLSRDPDWLVALVEKIGPKRVGLVADFGNFDGDIYAGMKRLLPYTKSVCTKSREFDAAGNETTINFARMMKLVKDSKYHGCIAIEHLGDEPMSGIRKSVALVKQAL